MMRTNYLFVDFENVQETDMTRIADKPVKVTLVLGCRHKKLPVSLVKLIQSVATQVTLVETPLDGKNALDFVLACLVGNESARDPQGYFHVISRDTGFDALIAHLKGQGIRAARHESFCEIPILMNSDERASLVARQLAGNTANRPKKRDALESVVQTVCGKGLSRGDVEETIQKLVQDRIVTFSENGAVSYAA